MSVGLLNPALPARIVERVDGESCGCAMGAKFLAVALVFSTVWYVWRRHSLTLSAGGIVWRIVAWTFAAAMVGKATGIFLYWMKSRRRLRRA
jgi:hypothetical protein